MQCAFLLLGILTLLEFASTVEEEKDWLIGLEKITTVAQVDLVEGVEKDYICIGSMQFNRNSKTELLISICSPSSLNKSGGIGTVSLQSLSRPANVLYGNVASLRPVTNEDWDGIGTAAQIKTPEHLYQAKKANFIYFVDDKSCARAVNRLDGAVSTEIGVCGSGTLDLDPVTTLEQRLIFGMTFYEDKQMWVFALVNLGVYVYDQRTKQGRRLIDIVDMSHTVSDSVQQIIKAPPPNEQILWQKVSEGMNYYDLTSVNATHGEVKYNNNLHRFLSASGQPAIDSTAEYYDQSYPALGQTNARLEFSPDENTLMIADTELDLIFYLYTKPNGEATVNASIDAILQVTDCVRNTSTAPRNDLDDCTIQSISDAIWLNNTHILIFERLDSSFRTFERHRMTSGVGNKLKHPAYICEIALLIFISLSDLYGFLVISPYIF